MTNNRLEERIEAARRNTDVEFDGDERARMLHRIQSDVAQSERRGTRTTIVVAAAAVLLLAGAWGAWLKSGTPEVAPEVAAVPVVFGPGTTVALEDGSVVDVDENSEVSVLEQTDELVAVKLREGAADFSVSKKPARSFVVDAGDVKVRVIGTRFRVTRDGPEVRVDVDEGIVEVNDGKEVVRLTAGEHFDTDEETVDTTAISTAEESAQASAGRVSQSAVALAEFEEVEETVEVPAWRRHLDAGDRDKAARSILDGDRVDNDFRSLELAADVLDSMGHHEKAIGYLERASKKARGAKRDRVDFRRGNLLLIKLNNPDKATGVFRSVAEGSSKFAEDALAREVEALAKSGKRAEAKRRASDYIERYPNGARMESVLMHGRGN